MVVAPVRVEAPVTARVDDRVAAPVTARVEDNVAAPVTARVEDRVVAPVTVRVEEAVVALARVTVLLPVPIMTALEPVAAKVKVVPEEVSDMPVIAPVFVIAQVLDVPTMSLVTPEPEVKFIPAPEPDVFET
jgi:hypothetical protein